MSKRLCNFLVFFCCLPQLIFAQITNIDSLTKSLRSAKEDTNKVKTLNAICKAFYSNIPDTAIAFAMQASTLAHKLNFINGEARAINNIGICSYFKGDYQQALQKHKQALALWQGIHNTEGIADAFNNMGMTYEDQGQYAEALGYYLKALKTYEQRNNNKRIAAICNNIGGLYASLKEFDKALEYYERSLLLKQQANNRQGVAMAYANMAIVYGDKQEHIKALEYYQKALTIRMEVQDMNGIATCYNNMGSSYMELKQYDKSFDCYMKALKIRREIGDKKGIATTLLNIGGLYAAQGGLIPSSLKKKNEDGANTQTLKDPRYIKKAISFYIDGIKIVGEIGAKDLLKDALMDMSNMYKSIGDYKSAYTFYQKYNEIKDSLFTTENNRQIAEISTKYETDRKDVQIKLLNKDKEVQQTKQRYTVIVLFVVLVLCGLLFMAFYNKRKANTILADKNHKIEQQNREINDSIIYARRIQQAILPSVELIHQVFEQAFILYKPKNVVSGDFYVFAEREETVILAAVDCTGHGVPGAFMSVIGHNLLTEIIVGKGIIKPSEILEKLNKEVRKALKQDKNNTRDGMDIVLCSINRQAGTLQYAGANRPLWWVQSSKLHEKNDVLTEIKATKASIGGHTDANQVFENHELKLEKGDSLYFSSDGYADQFGGAEGRKMMTKKFKETICNIQHVDMHEQEIALNKNFEEWKGAHEQVDDVLVMGIKL